MKSRKTVTKNLYPFFSYSTKEKIMKLSDAYKERNGETGLEVTVKMININQDSHHEILEKCAVLKEYSQFINTIRKYQNAAEKEPYKKAI